MLIIAAKGKYNFMQQFIFIMDLRIIKILFALVLFFHTSNSKSLGIKPEKSSVDGDLAFVINEIIRKILIYYSTTINIIKVANDNQVSDILVNEILLMNQTEPSYDVRMINLLDSKILKSRRKKCIVVLLDAIESFEKLNEFIDPDMFLFRGRILFVLVKGKFDEIEEIFSTFWKKNIFNVNVIFRSGKLIKIMSFLPFENSKCGDTTPKVINTFVNGVFTKSVESIFPDKFKNLQTCSVRVSTFEDKLSVIRKQNPDLSVELSGFDIEILTEFSKLLNFKTEIKFYEGPQPWGSFYPNGSVDGSLGEVLNGRADVAIGRYYLLIERIQIADSSFAYYSFPNVFVISPGKDLTNFEKLLRPFKSLVWISLLATLMLALVVVLILNYKLKKYKSFVIGTDVQHPVLNILIGVLGGAQPTLPKRNFARFLLALFLMFCLVLRNAYQGSLFKFLQSNEKVQDIQTVHDMIEQNYKMFMYESQRESLSHTHDLVGRY